MTATKQQLIHRSPLKTLRAPGEAPDTLRDLTVSLLYRYSQSQSHSQPRQAPPDSLALLLSDFILHRTLRFWPYSPLSTLANRSPDPCPSKHSTKHTINPCCFWVPKMYRLPSAGSERKTVLWGRGTGEGSFMPPDPKRAPSLQLPCQ